MRSGHGTPAFRERPRLVATSLGSNLTRTVAKLGGIDLATLRQVVAIGPADRRFALIAARGPQNEICLSLGGSLLANAFHCLDDTVGQRAVIDYVTGGGNTPKSHDHTTVIGVARSEVARLVMTLTDGSHQGVVLNRWRAFAYAANSPEPLPAALTAYNADGAVLEHLIIGEGSLCGGAAGPCTGVN